MNYFKDGGCRRRALGFLVVAICLAACTSVSTVPVSRLNDTDVDPNAIKGLFYYLPVGKIHITGGAPAAKSPDTTAKAIPEAGSAATAPADPGTGGQQTASPKADYVITVSAVIEADSNQPFFLKLDRNYFYDDDIALTVGSNGLLTTGKAVSTDQTASILAAFTSTATSILGNPLYLTLNKHVPTVADLKSMLVSPDYPDGYQLPSTILAQLQSAFQADGQSPRSELGHIPSDFVSASKLRSAVSIADVKVYLSFYLDTQPATKAYKALTDLLNPAPHRDAPKPFDVVFDPSRLDKKAICARISNACGMTVTCEAAGPSFPRNFSDRATHVSAESHSDPSHTDGIAFRTAKIWTVHIVSQDMLIDRSQQVLLPDSDSTLLLDYKRMPFVKKTTNIGFSNGMLVQFSQTVPSPVLGFFGIPKAILQAILPIPGGSSKSSGTTSGN